MPQLVTGAMADDSLDTLDDTIEPHPRHQSLSGHDETPGSANPHSNVSGPPEEQGRWTTSDWSWTSRSWQPGSWDSRDDRWNGTYAARLETVTPNESNGVAIGSDTGASDSRGSNPLTVQDPWRPQDMSGSVGAGVSSDSWQSADWQRGRWGWQDWRGWGWQRTDWWDSSSWSQPGSTRPDYSDPPTWPGWAHRRLWVQAVKRWDKQTDVPTFKRAEKLLRTFGWEMQIDFEHLSDGTLGSSGYLDAIIEIINNKAGVREDDEKRRAYKQAITDSQRHRDETLAQYAQRRMRDFRSAATFGVVIPDPLKAMLLKEGAGLSDQSQQNLAALVLDRDDDPEAIARALARLDVRHDRLSAFGTSDEQSGTNYMAADEEATADDESLDDEEVIQELDQLDLNEDQIVEVFAVLDQRKTWKQNKLLKTDMKKDRGSFMKDGNHSHPRGHLGGVPGHQKPAGRGQLNKEQLKKISKCRMCGKRGHWAEDCNLKKKPGPSAFSYCGDSSQSSTAFTYLTMQTLREVVSRVVGSGGGEESSSWAFLALPGGEAILDIGATQDLIGAKAMDELSSVCWQQPDFNP